MFVCRNSDASSPLSPVTIIMRFCQPLHAHRPVSHPIFGPTIHRPTHMIPTVFQGKRPIPSSLLSPDQIVLPPSPSSSSQKAKDRTKTSTKIIRAILTSSQKEIQRSSTSHQYATSKLNAQIWPQNLRVEDDWRGRGKWGESRPDHLEWLGVQKKHKDLMLSLRAER